MNKFNSHDTTLGQFVIRRYLIIGERRISNYWWTFLVFLGSIGFLFTGIFSYFGVNGGAYVTQFIDFFTPHYALHSVQEGVGSPLGLRDVPFIAEPSYQELSILPLGGPVPYTYWGGPPAKEGLSFFPQGLLMSFYGILGFCLSFYWGLLIFWNVGGGFNEFNKKNGLIRVFRWGFPGKNRRIDFSYPLKDVEAIKVELTPGQIGSPLNPAQRTIFMRLKGKRNIPLTGIGQPLTLKDIEKQASELANFLQVSIEGL